MDVDEDMVELYNIQKLACENTSLLVPDGGCKPNFDTVLCWPPTSPNTIAVLSCFSQLNGILYDATRK